MNVTVVPPSSPAEAHPAKAVLDTQAWTPEPEPLARAEDAVAVREALARFRAGEWDEETWTAFRLRHGVYGQRQPGVQMVRIKVPGGILPFAWARAVAAANRAFAKDDIHLTTRQDFQLYHVATDRVPDLLDSLAAASVTTREACGNTLRNFTACAFAGVCPREHVDAGKVAAQLSQSWIRSPLVQNMPRKFKATVSGCAVDCGASGIHDLGLVATEVDGRQGFAVFAGGGAGGQPVAAVKIAGFVTEDAIPAVLEALVRLHQKYSNRVDRNKARLKFLIKRFGAQSFRKLFEEEFERVRAMPQRPWPKLIWRSPEGAGDEVPSGTIDGILAQHDGRVSVVASPELGLLSADQLEALAGIGERYGADHLRTTREQNIALVGLAPDDVEEAVAAIRAGGLPVAEPGSGEPDLVTCPGTTTCRIGITNSQAFGRELLAVARGIEGGSDLRLRISGCQNGCGLHHVGDFGFRGMAKKIGGAPAPQYQIYLGGNDREIGAIASPGPIVPARLARRALELLLAAYAPAQKAGTGVRDWAERLGRQGIETILAPLAEGDRAAALEAGADDAGLHVDWGDEETFAPPPANVRAECAAGFAQDALYRNLADDALINVDRCLHAGRKDAVLDHGRASAAYAAQRLLGRLDLSVSDDEPAEIAFARVTGAYADEHPLIATLDALRGSETAARVANGSADLDAYREALALWLDTVEEVCQRPLVPDSPAICALADSGGGVAALIAGGDE